MSAAHPVIKSAPAKNGLHKSAKIRQVQLVGRKIRRLRKERRLTQTELANRIGIQQSDLSRMEKGEYRVSLDTLFRILAEFDVSVAAFFEEEEAAGAAETENLSPRQVRMARDLESLSPEAQREVEEFIAFKRGQRPPEDPRRS